MDDSVKKGLIQFWEFLRRLRSEKKFQNLEAKKISSIVIKKP